MDDENKKDEVNVSPDQEDQKDRSRGGLRPGVHL